MSLLLPTIGLHFVAVNLGPSMCATTGVEVATDDVKDEAELMGRYCDGDPAAFHALYRCLAPRILAYLVGIIGERAPAEDLLQQTFLKVHQSRGVYIRGANPAPWIYAIAHRSCLDELRRRKRARTRLTADGTLPSEPRAAITGKPQELADAEQDSEPPVTLAALDHLPANQREALVLTKVHGHSVAAAAVIAGTTPGAIKLRAHRAYVTLRRKLSRGATTTTEPRTKR